MVFNRTGAPFDQLEGGAKSEAETEAEVKEKQKIGLSLVHEGGQVFLRETGSGLVVSEKWDEIAFLSASGGKMMIARRGGNWFILTGRKHRGFFERNDDTTGGQGYVGLKVARQENISMGGVHPMAVFGDVGDGKWNHIAALWAPYNLVPDKYDYPGEVSDKGHAVG